MRTVLGVTAVVLLLALPAAAGESGVPATYDEVMDWYGAAARSGDPRAQYLLARRLEAGVGGPRDAVAALHWYWSAADAGIAEAQYKMGLLAAAGVALPRDEAAAAAWYLRAARRGYAPAQFNYAAMLVNGTGVAADAAEALAWLDAAAAGGLEQARTLRARLLRLLPEEVVSRGRERTRALRRELSAAD